MLNKKFWGIYLIIFFVAFTLISIKMYQYVQIPLIQDLISKMGSLSKSLTRATFYVAEPIDDSSYEIIATTVQSLPGIQKLTIIQPERKIFVLHDIRKVSRDEIFDALQKERFDVSVKEEREGIRKLVFRVDQSVVQQDYDKIVVIIEILSGIESVRVDMVKKEVLCIYDGLQVNSKSIMDMIITEGYAISKISDTKNTIVQ